MLPLCLDIIEMCTTIYIPCCHAHLDLDLVTDLGDRGVPLIFLNRLGMDSSSNGSEPHSNAYRMTPQLQTSTSGPEYSFPEITCTLGLWVQGLGFRACHLAFGRHKSLRHSQLQSQTPA